MGHYVVRRITPLECERLQGFPEIVEADVEKMNSDQLIKWAIVNKDIIVDIEKGKVYGTRGPGGIKLKEPVELGFKHPTGYIHVSLHANGQKKQVRVHRIVYIAAYGDIPEGAVIDHINTIKDDNRICNLQALTPEDNSHKAKEDGAYDWIYDEEKNSRLIPYEIRSKIWADKDSLDMSYGELSKRYNLSKGTIASIIKNRKGFTDIGEWTDKKGKKRVTTDAARYKALGNSMAVPCMRWIAQRIDWALANPITEDTSEPVDWQPDLFGF